MRHIILNREQLVFSYDDLPIMIHGKEGSGASLFSIVAATEICRSGMPLLFWSAYPMAKEEFRKEFIETARVHSVAKASEIGLREPQVILMENSDLQELSAALLKIDSDRVVFVKNFETLPAPLRATLLERKRLFVSGDLEGTLEAETVLKFSTRIFFSPFSEIDVPALEKYDAFMASPEKRGVVNISD